MTRTVSVCARLQVRTRRTVGCQHKTGCQTFYPFLSWRGESHSVTCPQDYLPEGQTNGFRGWVVEGALRPGCEEPNTDRPTHTWHAGGHRDSSIVNIFDVTWGETFLSSRKLLCRNRSNSIWKAQSLWGCRLRSAGVKTKERKFVQDLLENFARWKFWLGKKSGMNALPNCTHLKNNTIQFVTKPKKQNFQNHLRVIASKCRHSGGVRSDHREIFCQGWPPKKISQSCSPDHWPVAVLRPPPPHTHTSPDRHCLNFNPLQYTTRARSTGCALYIPSQIWQHFHQKMEMPEKATHHEIVQTITISSYRCIDPQNAEK